MLENTSREMRAGEWALLYDSTSRYPGSCGSAGDWNRGQKLISCFEFFFFMKRSFFISPPMHWFCTTGARGRASKITGPFSTRCSGIKWYLSQHCAEIVYKFQVLCGFELLPHSWFLMQMSGTSLIWSKSGCCVTHSLCECLTFPLLWTRAGKEVGLFRKEVVFCCLLSIHTLGRKDIPASLWNICLNYNSEEVAEEMP